MPLFELALALLQDPPPLYVSTAEAVPGFEGAGLAPGALLRVGAGEEPRLQRGAGHWLASAGVVPAQVDALGRRPGLEPGRLDALGFSLSADAHGALDGDVLSVAPGGGLQVLVHEVELALALGVLGSDLDLDALAWDAAGRLCFSLAEDLPASSLGPVADGDVLRLEAHGGCTRPWTEAALQAEFQAATQSNSALGNLRALEIVEGAWWVVVDGADSHDGAVLLLGDGLDVIADEDALGLGGAALDALAAVELQDEPPCLRIEPAQASPGQALLATVRGGQPAHPLLVLAAGGVGWVEAEFLLGAGAFVLDPLDPWLSAATLAGHPVQVLDLQGEASVPFQLPPDSLGGVGWAGEWGWSFQLVDLESLLLSEPFRVGV